MNMNESYVNPMDAAYLKSVVDGLRVFGERFASGLTDSEVGEIETKYGFLFPPDLRAFLQFALPVSTSWVNWRKASEKSIRNGLNGLPMASALMSNTTIFG